MYRHGTTSPRRAAPGAATPEMSRASVNARNKNVVANTALEKELRLLEKERAQHMQAMRHEAKQFRVQSAVIRSSSPAGSSRPGSSRPGSSMRPFSSRTGSASPRRPGGLVNPRLAAGSVSPSRVGGRLGGFGRQASPRGSPRESPRGSPTRGSPTRGRSPSVSPQVGSATLLPGRQKATNTITTNGHTTSTTNNSTTIKKEEISMSPVRYSSNVFVVEQGSDVLQHVAVPITSSPLESQSPASRPPQVRRAATMDYGVPAIVISDDADSTTTNNNNHSSSNNNLHVRFDDDNNTTTSTTTITSLAIGAGRRRGSLDGSSAGPTFPGSHIRSGSPPTSSESLGIPFRPRSRSVSAIVVPNLPAIIEGVRAQQRRPSFSSDQPPSPRQQLSPASSNADLHVPGAHDRGRRHSFNAGIMPSLKRGSIAELWGSASERERPRLRGGKFGQGGSVEFDQAFREILASKGFLEDHSARPQISDEQWEELKSCRYLRMPDRDRQEQDEGNDIDAIFQKDD